VQKGVPVEHLHSEWQGWVCKDKTLGEDDVRRALNYLQKKNKLHKAPGMDNVANWMLVWGGEGTVQMLTPLYKEVWNTAKMPTEWNKALVRYIYKGKGSKLEVSNYRPISLLSVIAKLYTVILLPWVGEAVGPHLVVEQGCAKPNQGHVEHLWAFMSLAEDAMEGRDGEGEGMHAFFADAHKAYDQVWRDGLYLTLYTQGVRGKLWASVQAWLNGAVAVTDWNGVRGPQVALHQGLRQGCVLSPILYCAFINVFLAAAPKVQMPPGMEWLKEKVHMQGMQGAKGCEEGVFSPPLGRRVKAMLFMDDTTLVAKTRKGLKGMVARYLHFCRMFRIRLNPGKSKMMHFTKGVPNVSPMMVNGVEVECPKGGTQNYLGFVMDAGLTGVPQMKRMQNMVSGKALVVAAVAKAMGEFAAVWYLRVCVEPAALYGLELLPFWASKQVAQVERAFNKLVVEALRCGALNEWWNGEVKVRHGLLHREVNLWRWLVVMDKRMMSVLRSLAVARHSLAAQMFTARMGHMGQPTKWGMSFGSMVAHAKGSFLDKVLRVAESFWGPVQGAWPVWTPGKEGRQRLKEAMGKVMKMKQAVMDAADAMIRAPNEHGRQASELYVKSFSGVGWQARGYAGCWTGQLSWMVPNVAHRVLMRRMMMGSIPHLRANVLKWGKGFKVCTK